MEIYPFSVPFRCFQVFRKSIVLQIENAEWVDIREDTLQVEAEVEILVDIVVVVAAMRDRIVIAITVVIAVIEMRAVIDIHLEEIPVEATIIEVTHIIRAIGVIPSRRLNDIM